MDKRLVKCDICNIICVVQTFDRKVAVLYLAHTTALCSVTVQTQVCI